MFLQELDLKEKEAFLCLAQELIKIDGKIAEEEETYLSLYKEEMRLDELKNTYLHNEACNLILDSVPTVRRKVYMELYALAKCDADYDDREQIFLRNLTELWSISYDIKENLEECVDELMIVYKKMGDLLNK